MRLIDEKGRLFRKLSVIDLFVVILVAGLIIGYLYKQTSADVIQIITANQKFYVTFLSEKVRSFSVEAVHEGDVFYKKHERQPLGCAVRVRYEQARDIMTKTDGTALLAPMEDRYNLFITLEVQGSINENGYYVNGNLQVSEGSDFTIHSNNLMLSIATIYEVSETLDP